MAVLPGLDGRAVCLAGESVAHHRAGGNALDGNTDAAAETQRAARGLWRAARAATLATQSDGQPYAALVTPAVAPDGSALLLLSGLSVHTRHLRREPRCALLVSGVAQESNPQTAPRLTVTGTAAPEPDAAWRSYWVERHPYAAFYADLPDFAIWRVTPEAGHFVAGFARAGTLTRADLLPHADIVEALGRASPRILEHCNTDHAEALALLTGAEPARRARMVGVDADGFDAIVEGVVHRVPFDRPVADAQGVRAALVRMVRAAREAGASTPPVAPGAGRVGG